MKTKWYRIVRDGYAGYEAQILRVWFPFWIQIGHINTHRTAEEAEKYIKNYKRIIKYVDK